MTQAARKIATHIEELPAGSLRREVLESARRFKSSWVELGRMLTQVKRESLWQEWGFASFDAYCAKELFIRKGTAEKLTMSYGFLERHEPSLVREPRARRDRDEEAEEAEPGRAPAFEVIEVLSRAEAAGRFDADGWSSLREEVLDAPSASAVNRQLTDRFGPAPRPAGPGEEERLRKLAALAARLAQACAGDDAVPRAVAERARDLATEIAELAEG